MKPIKILFTVLTVFIVNLTFAQNKLSNDVEVKDGYLKFLNETVFEKILTLDDVKKAEYLKNVEGISEFNAFGKNQFVKESIEKSEEDYENAKALFSLLNTNGMIQIDKYIISINLKTSTANVLFEENAKEEELKKMINHEVSENIGTFPLEVDLFAALDEGLKTMPTEENIFEESETLKGFLPGRQLAFHESMYWNPTKPGDKNWPKDERMDGVISYDAYAIFFHFYAKEKYLKENGIGLWTITTGGNRDWYVTYDLRCQPNKRDLISQDRIRLNPGFGVNGGENKLDKTFYQGTRRVLTAYVRWDVTLPSAREVEVYRGTTEGIRNQNLIFRDSR